MLERRVDLQRDHDAGVEDELGAEQRRVRRHRRGVRRGGSRGTPARASRRRRQLGRRVVLEARDRCRGSRPEARPTAGRRAASWSPPVETSEWLIPRPAVIRLTSPGSTIAWWPALSRCSISPSNSQLTVCSPVCGCGATDIPPESDDRVRPVVVEEAPGPDQAPLPLRQRASYGHRPRAAERHLPRRHDLDARRIGTGAHHLVGSCLLVAHPAILLPPANRPQSARSPIVHPRRGWCRACASPSSPTSSERRRAG